MSRKNLLGFATLVQQRCFSPDKEARVTVTLAKSKQLFWEYDPTRGFAGQDILTQNVQHTICLNYQNVSPTIFLLLFVFVSLSLTNNFFVTSCFLLTSSLLLHSELSLDNCVKECSSSRHVGLALLQLDTSLLCCCSFLLIYSGTINFSVASYFFLAPLLLLRSRLLFDNFTKDCPLSRQPGPVVKLLAAIFPCRCSLSLICPGTNNFLSVSCSFLTSSLLLHSRLLVDNYVKVPYFVLGCGLHEEYLSGRCGSLSLTVTSSLVSGNGYWGAQ